MATSTSHRAMRVPDRGADLSLAQVETRDPGLGEVRVTVEACGVCHSDVMISSGDLPGSTFPITPGHEIAGRIDAIGDGVAGWSVGDRVAVGWYGGSCGYCDACREGDGIHCPRLKIPGVAYPGGFADSVAVPAVALAAIPDELTAAEAAPLACAGVTVYNALRRSAARSGDTVAILGVGGLGHLGVQFAREMGFDTVAIARGQEKAKLARELGAAHYIDSTSENVPETLQRLGGAKVVLATVTSSAAMSATLDGLGRRGELVVAGATMEPLDVTPVQLIGGGKKIYGHAAGIAVDIQRTMRFAAQTGVRPWIEQVPLEQAQTAMARMLSGQARFRMVLTTGN
ncbi:alcohol dehydrogenase catalytic domain-containing protein [Amycolatopsis taiwanensis]|uniref:Alcohol dehydrogenase n=1 Tax=Amycolatopsis taiwanensis TaxID=342230 RepID=A0A9W6VG10_9PSEU|nr:alcohol dehydrogenase catalytic domain-containing protein [Amycolatopsis taiwanensis]GLY65031.1 alcohol dehydrogenase [Amycolatopsis taiwanensis]